MNDEYTRGWNDALRAVKEKIFKHLSVKMVEDINSLKKEPMNTPEPAHEHHWTPWAYYHESYEGERTLICSCGMTETRKFVHRDTPEPNWQELESALWAARSQTNEIANRGIDRVVSFFKKLHERTEPKEESAFDTFFKSEEPVPAPDLTEGDLKALILFYGENSIWIPRLISELRRRRKEAKEKDSKALFIEQGGAFKPVTLGIYLGD